LVVGLLLLILFPGCGPISKELRAQTDRTLSFQQVFQNPEAFQGKIMIWGGEIIETTNQKDGTTLIVILQRPLDWMEEPKIERSEGRFIILVEGYVDPYVFRRGRRITVAGEILGKKLMRLGENLTTLRTLILIIPGGIMDTMARGGAIRRNDSFFSHEHFSL
jgi:outer membrane lipoprotein